MAERVASIVGIPGMCSDDGRALTYYYQTYLNENSGKGFYREGGNFSTEEAAEAHLVSQGYTVTSKAWT